MSNDNYIHRLPGKLNRVQGYEVIQVDTLHDKKYVDTACRTVHKIMGINMELVPLLLQ